MVIAGLPPGIHRVPAQQLARRELARSLYQKPLLDRILARIDQWLSSLGGHGPGLPDPVALLIAAVVVAAVIGGFIWLGPARRSGRRGSAQVLGGTSLSAADHRRNAERLAAEGDYGEAIAERVRAIAVDLERRSVVAPRPGRTAAELAAETAAALPPGALPGGAARLHDAARLFDDVRYGGRAGSQAGYEQVRDLDTALMSVRAASAAPVLAAAGQGTGPA